MRWSADLYALTAGMSSADLARLQSLAVKLKAPSPRLGEIVAPKGFAAAHTKGGATVTFTKEVEGDFPVGEKAIASVMYVQTEPMAAMRTLDRIVEVSHWGSNLAVQDNVELYNAGPK